MYYNGDPTEYVLFQNLTARPWSNVERGLSKSCIQRTNEVRTWTIGVVWDAHLSIFALNQTFLLMTADTDATDLRGATSPFFTSCLNYQSPLFPMRRSYHQSHLVTPRQYPRPKRHTSQCRRRKHPYNRGMSYIPIHRITQYQYHVIFPCAYISIPAGAAIPHRSVWKLLLSHCTKMDKQNSTQASFPRPGLDEAQRKGSLGLPMRTS